MEGCDFKTIEISNYWDFSISCFSKYCACVSYYSNLKASFQTISSNFLNALKAPLCNVRWYLTIHFASCTHNLNHHFCWWKKLHQYNLANNDMISQCFHSILAIWLIVGYIVRSHINKPWHIYIIKKGYIIDQNGYSYQSLLYSLIYWVKIDFTFSNNS